ncbi:MAG: hypothetical protein HRF43_19855, partial [Phycisphaerae bacterium]
MSRWARGRWGVRFEASAGFLVFGLFIAGCSRPSSPARHEEAVWCPAGTVIAVAPALNFSGNTNFDPIIAADLMASELSGFPGLGVIGVNRTLAVLSEQGLARIQSPRHALEVADRLGADAILVFAITEYDAYTPVVGIAAQLYSRRPVLWDLSEGAAPGPAATRPAGPEPARLLAECQQVFNAAHESVRNAVRDYADKRNGGESPYGWRKYLVSQERFLRFCCYAVARDLLRQQTIPFGVARAEAQGES